MQKSKQQQKEEEEEERKRKKVTITVPLQSYQSSARPKNGQYSLHLLKHS